jgi:hypothetical protein
VADDEVLAAEVLHQAAQARLGIAAALVSAAEWRAVSELNASDTSSPWLAASLRAITAVRKMSRRLAIAHYQLIRALETGRTLGVPEGSPSTARSTTLGTLRTNFRSIALDIASLPSSRERSDDPDILWFEQALDSIQLDDAEVEPLIQDLLDVEGNDGGTTILIDRHTWPDDMTLEEVDEAFRALLMKQAVMAATAKVQAVRSRTDLTPAEALDEIEVAYASAGSIGSGTVDAAGMAAGRAAAIDAIKKDRRVVQVARGTSANPCAICSMFASRGFETPSEGVGIEIQSFHIHCHCHPIYRFTQGSPLPVMNAYFQEKWPVVTAGLTGNDARKAWRRWIYAQRKANPTAPHAAALQP